MDEQKRASLLDDLAGDAARKREAFMGDAGRQFVRFLDANKYRLKELDGLVLLDDESEYLFVTAEGTFRSRTRYLDEDGEWVSETEDVANGADLIEIFNPADIYAAFVDAAKDEAELAEAQDEDEDEDEDAPDDEAEAATKALDYDLNDDVEDDDDWLGPVPTPRDKPEAARVMYDLALTFQERSQIREAQLLNDFAMVSEGAAAILGDSKVAEDEDERLWFRASGAFEGEVVPEEDENGEPLWRSLTTHDEMVQFYDPTDLFGDLADALAEAHPDVAPELADEDAAQATDGESDET